MSYWLEMEETWTFPMFGQKGKRKRWAYIVVVIAGIYGKLTFVPYTILNTPNILFNFHTIL